MAIHLWQFLFSLPLLSGAFLSGIFFSEAVLSAREKTDSIASLSAVPGADMAFYDLYACRAECGEREEAMKNAVIFMNGLDPSVPDPVAARICIELTEWYEKEKCLFSEALLWCGRAHQYYIGLDDRYGQAKTEYSLAKLYYKKKQFHNALPHVLSARAFFDERNYEKDRLKCDNLLGAIYFVCKDYENTNRYFQLYAAGCRRLGDSSSLTVALNNLAAYMNVTGDTLKTRALIGESIRIAGEISDSSMICKSYTNIAATYINSGKYDEAERYLGLAYPYLRSVEEAGRYWLNCAILARRSGRKSDAIAYLESAVDVLEGGEFEPVLQSCYSRLYELYQETGDVENAAKALASWYEIDRAFAQDDTFLELFRYQSQILQQKEAEKMAESRRLHRFYMMLMICVLIVLSFLGYLRVRKKAEIIRLKESELLARRLQNEKNEQEIRSKNEILEIKRMQQYSLDRLTEDVIGKLNALNLEIKESSLRSKVQDICNELRHSRDESQWKEVNQYIPEFNSTFFQKLLNDFPDLTVNERRLCALLNLNMSTKEISEVTRQSPHSIDIARGRLRNKLGLKGNNISLQEFLSKYN